MKFFVSVAAFVMLGGDSMQKYIFYEIQAQHTFGTMVQFDLQVLYLP